jgi:3-oxoacyl-[acyl-carrier protein] reductase
LIDLQGRVALVTGASRSIGRAIALAIAERGAAVAVNFQTRAEHPDAVVAKIRSSGGQAIAVRADVSVGAEACIPVGHMGQAEDVAKAAVMVIDNDFIAGHTIAVNGGMAFL